MTKIIFFTLFSCKLFALNCSTEAENLRYENLSWSLGSKYNVYSSAINIEGLLCIGFNGGKQISRIHYFDDLGTKVLKSAAEVMNKDVVFFARSVMPSYAKMLLKKVDPMTLSLKLNSNNQYEFRLTFIENMMKSFRSAKIREIKIDVNTLGEFPIFTHRDKRFDEFEVNVNNGLKIKSIKTYLEGALVKQYAPYKFKLTSRRY